MSKPSARITDAEGSLSTTQLHDGYTHDDDNVTVTSIKYVSREEPSVNLDIDAAAGGPDTGDDGNTQLAGSPSTPSDSGGGVGVSAYVNTARLLDGDVLILDKPDDTRYFEQEVSDESAKDAEYDPDSGLSYKDTSDIDAHNKRRKRMESSGDISAEDWAEANGAVEKDLEEGKLVPVETAAKDTLRLAPTHTTAESILDYQHATIKPEEIDVKRIQRKLRDMLGTAFTTMSSDERDVLVDKVVTNMSADDFAKSITIGDTDVRVYGQDSEPTVNTVVRMVGDTARLMSREQSMEFAVLTYAIKGAIDEDITIAIPTILEKITDHDAARDLLMDNLHDAALKSNVVAIGHILDFIGDFSVQHKGPGIIQTLFENYSVSGTGGRDFADDITEVCIRLWNRWDTNPEQRAALTANATDDIRDIMSESDAIADIIVGSTYQTEPLDNTIQRLYRSKS